MAALLAEHNATLWDHDVTVIRVTTPWSAQLAEIVEATERDLESAKDAAGDGGNGCLGRLDEADTWATKLSVYQGMPRSRGARARVFCTADVGLPANDAR